MATSVELALLTIGIGMIGLIALVGTALIWIDNSMTAPPSIKPSPVDPILGARDKVAIYASHGPFFPMPDHLKTREEMVAWMTRELPKLTAETTAPPDDKPRA